MKNKTITLIIALLLMSASAFSQGYAFKVMTNKGSNEVKSGDVWQLLKTGASLSPSDEIKLVENAYIGLIHASGRLLEIRQSGSYKVADLASKVGSGSSVLNKYADFILSSNAETKKNKLSATGAVHRATETSAIKVMLPENQLAGIYNTSAVINWDGEKVQGPYIVRLKDLFEDQLAEIETPETTLTISLVEPKFLKENAILVEISSKADPKQVSKQHLIRKLSGVEQEKIRNSLKAIVGEVSENTALNKLIIAGFYEENNLIIDAIVAYEEALKLAPDVPAYKEAYDEFLIRQGLIK